MRVILFVLLISISGCDFIQHTKVLTTPNGCVLATGDSENVFLPLKPNSYYLIGEKVNFNKYDGVFSTANKEKR